MNFTININPRKSDLSLLSEFLQKNKSLFDEYKIIIKVINNPKITFPIMKVSDKLIKGTEDIVKFIVLIMKNLMKQSLRPSATSSAASPPADTNSYDTYGLSEDLVYKSISDDKVHDSWNATSDIQFKAEDSWTRGGYSESLDGHVSPITSKVRSILEDAPYESLGKVSALVIHDDSKELSKPIAPIASSIASLPGETIGSMRNVKIYTTPTGTIDTILDEFTSGGIYDTDEKQAIHKFNSSNTYSKFNSIRH